MTLGRLPQQVLDTRIGTPITNASDAARFAFRKHLARCDSANLCEGCGLVVAQILGSGVLRMRKGKGSTGEKSPYGDLLVYEYRSYTLRLGLIGRPPSMVLLPDPHKRLY
jgi:hypothetical protein